MLSPNFNKAAHAVGPEANVWGIGMCIYQLMSLCEAGDFGHSVDIILKEGPSNNDLANSGDCIDGVDSAFEFPHDADEAYSRELQELVRACLRLDPLARPSTTSLKESIQQGMDRERTRLYNDWGPDEDRVRYAASVIFDPEEWNRTPQGPFDFQVRHDREFWRAWDEKHVFSAEDGVALLPPIIHGNRNVAGGGGSSTSGKADTRRRGGRWRPYKAGRDLRGTSLPKHG